MIAVAASGAHAGHVLFFAWPVGAMLWLWTTIEVEERRDRARCASKVPAGPLQPIDAPTSRPPPDPGREHWIELLLVIAVLEVGSALIHASVAGRHFGESAVFGTFFMVAASAQIATAIWAVSRRGRMTIAAIVVLNLVILSVWLISRTVGIPLGPEPGVAEAVGAPDAISTLYEALTVGVGVVVLTGASAQRAPVRLIIGRMYPAVTGWTVALRTATPLLAGH